MDSETSPLGAWICALREAWAPLGAPAQWGLTRIQMRPRLWEPGFARPAWGLGTPGGPGAVGSHADPNETSPLGAWVGTPCAWGPGQP